MLFVPDIKLDRITEITPELLKKYNISGLLLDVDNTMSTHHGTKLVEGLTDWIEKMQDSGIKLLVLSNSRQFRVEPFAKRLGLDFISMGLKPLPNGFLKGAKKLGLKRKNVAIVGDQIFTDLLGGNAVGLKTVLLTPIKLESSFGFKIKRTLEKAIYKIHKYKKTQV